MLAISGCTASALTMICALNSWIKVRCHIGVWKSGDKCHANPLFEDRETWGRLAHKKRPVCPRISCPRISWSNAGPEFDKSS